VVVAILDARIDAPGLTNYLKTPTIGYYRRCPLPKEALPMFENPTREKPLPTIWRTPDGLWELIEPILQENTPHQRVPVVLA
jgi:hypothetical protein